MIDPKAIYQLDGSSLTEIIEEAARSATKVAKSILKSIDDEWVNEEEAMRILNCAKSKLYRLRKDDEIKFTPGYKKKYHKPSLHKYMESIA